MRRERGSRGRGGRHSRRARPRPGRRRAAHGRHDAGAASERRTGGTTAAAAARPVPAHGGPARRRGLAAAGLGRGPPRQARAGRGARRDGQDDDARGARGEPRGVSAARRPYTRRDPRTVDACDEGRAAGAYGSLPRRRSQGGRAAWLKLSYWTFNRSAAAGAAQLWRAHHRYGVDARGPSTPRCWPSSRQVKGMRAATASSARRDCPRPWRPSRTILDALGLGDIAEDRISSQKLKEIENEAEGRGHAESPGAKRLAHGRELLQLRG